MKDQQKTARENSWIHFSTIFVAEYSEVKKTDSTVVCSDHKHINDVTSIHFAGHYFFQGQFGKWIPTMYIYRQSE